MLTGWLDVGKMGGHVYIWIDVRMEGSLDKWIDGWTDTDYVGEKRNKEAGIGDG